MPRRRLGLLAICLTLGAILNVALAWSCALAYDTAAPATWLPLPDDEAQRIWVENVPPDWPRQPQSSFRTQRFGVTLANFTYFGDERFAIIPWLLITYETGWPLRSFAARAHKTAESDLQWESSIVFESSNLTRIVPVGPLWEGIAANTLFFAALVWMLIRGPAEARRRWREFHNRCGACGHLRGDTFTCSECGSDLSRAWFIRYQETERP